MTNAKVLMGRPPAAGPEVTLARAAIAWFVIALIGQWAFFTYIAAFYGPSTLSGHFETWAKNPMLIKGYVAGDRAGNLAFGGHALMAAVMALSGASQLIPQIRARWPRFHRWNGRVFMVLALGLSVTGLYMIWVRHADTGLAGRIAITGDAVLILTFGALAWRSAVARDFAAHRRWALRFFLVSSAQWFLRVAVFASLAVSFALTGRPPSIGGSLFTFWNFACYLLPLAVLELYLRTKDAGGRRGRLAMAAGLVAMTVFMAVGETALVLLHDAPLLAKL